MPLELLVECRTCEGRGSHIPAPNEPRQTHTLTISCTSCDGMGKALETVKSGVRDLFCLECDRCNGSGRLCDGHVTCGQCEGSGHYYRLADGRTAVDPMPEEAS